jgi:hypothetical protein
MAVSEKSGVESAYRPEVVRLTPFPGAVYSPSWRGRFPHLMPRDDGVWRRFLDAHGSEFLGVQYDILLGEGATVPDGISEADRRLLYYATAKRADCLLIANDKLVLVEVKSRLGMAAVGQCVSYWLLWQRQYGRGRRIEIACVCEQGEPDLQYVMDRLGFRVVIV